jgi:tetratricopeptide (TPR) repeat protein
LFYLGEIAFDNCDYERAVQLFNQALLEDDTLTGPRFRLAQYALMIGLWKEAANYLVSELKLAPEDVDTLVSMGSMFLTIGELDYATHCMMRAIDIDCAHAEAYYYLGLVSATRGRFEDSVEFFAHALDISPEHICALQDSAVVYLAMGRLADAARRIEKALPLADDDPQLKMLDRRVRRLQATERIRDFLCRFKP